MGGPHERLQRALAREFERWGRFVARRPLAVCVVGCALCIALCVGLLALTPENRSYYLWVPTESQAYRDWKYLEATFGVQGHTLLLYARVKQGGNIFSFECIDELLKAHEFTINLETTLADGSTIRFDQACKKQPGEAECYTPSFLELWDFSRERLRRDETPILDRITALHSASNIRTFAGKAKFDEDQLTGVTRVRSAEAVVLAYELNGENGLAYAIQPAWNAGIGGAIDSSVLQAAHYSTRSYDDEVARMVNGDIPLFAAGMVIITVYLALTLGPPRSLHRSRALLGLCAIVNGESSRAATLARLRGCRVGADLTPTRPRISAGRRSHAHESFPLSRHATTPRSPVLLAVGAAYGLASLCGVLFPSIAALLPLILLGVQVDSVIILVDNLNAENPADPLEARVGRSLAKSGPAVLLTSLTTICAFATSTATDMPAVAMFASFAALSFTCAMVVIFSFFLALLVLDERRLMAGRVSCTPCIAVGRGCTLSTSIGAAHRVAASPAVAPEPGSLPVKVKGMPTNQASQLANLGRVQRFLRDYYAPALLSKPGSIIVVIVFAALSVVSLLVLPRIEVGLPNRDVLPDDSYILDALEVEDTYFNGGIGVTEIIFSGEDYDNPRLRERFRSGRHRVNKMDSVLLSPTDWMTAYDIYLRGRSWDKYTDRLQDFLEADGGTLYQDQIACGWTSRCNRPRATKYNAIHRLGLGDAITNLERRRNITATLRREGFGDDLIVFQEQFLLAEADAKIWVLTYQNLVRAPLSRSALRHSPCISAPCSFLRLLHVRQYCPRPSASRTLSLVGFHFARPSTCTSILPSGVCTGCDLWDHAHLLAGRDCHLRHPLRRANRHRPARSHLGSRAQAQRHKLR
jgi:hypothetical protein